MNTFARFTLVDRIILSGSMLILLVLSYFLYDDSLLFPTELHTQSSIGTISFSAKDVRKKNVSDFVWLPGNQEDQVYDQDSIFTGDDSHASVQLNDGSIIKIEENSLVNLNTKNGQMQLDLRFGQFAGNGKTPLHIKTGNEEYTIQGNDAQFEINRSPSGIMDVKVISGTAEISSKTGKQKLKANESLKISKNKTEKNTEKNAVKVNIHLLTKDHLFIVRSTNSSSENANKDTPEKNPISFEWKGQGPLAQYQLEIAKTADFKKILALHSTKDQKMAIKDVFQEGSYYWRVKGLDLQQKTLVTSVKHKFSLSDMLPPTITTPEEQSTISNKVIPTATELQTTTKISWEAAAPTESFQWQLSQSESFAEILNQKDLREKSLITPSLGQGTYFTRVRGFDKNQHASQWSQVRSFKIEFQTEAKPPAPRLVEKHLRFSIPKLEGRAPSAATSPQLAWFRVNNIKNYQWEIANNKRFVGAQAAKTSATKVAWTQYKPGKYYFRVFARSDLGQISDASETGELEVYGDAPQLQPIPGIMVREANLEAQAPPKEVPVNWSAVEEAKSYLIQLDNTPDFANPLEIKSDSAQSTVPLPKPGKYFVRVKAFNESMQEISQFSNVEDANYIFKQTLKAPPLIEPYDKTTVFLQKDMEPFIWLEWNSVQGASKYNLEISATANFSRVLISKTLAETRFLIKEKIPYGTIFWRVNAASEDESLRSDWSLRQFMIYHQRNDGF